MRANPRRSRSKKLAEHTHPDPVSGNRGRHLRTPPRQPGGSAAGAGLRKGPAAHAAAGPASMRGSLSAEPPCPSARRWRRRRRRTCVHRRTTDAPDGAPPPRGTQRRTRHRRMTTVSSTSSFCRRRRRRRLLGRQATGRGTTFGAGCAARRAAAHAGARPLLGYGRIRGRILSPCKL